MIQKNRFLLLTILFFTIVFDMFSQNPIVQTNYTADPGSLAYKDKFYIYAGRDEAASNGKWFKMREWRVYSSSDMVNWTDHGPRLKPLDFKWSNGDAWASQCVEKNGKFYWYVSASHKEKGGKAIGVAVSDSPTGPFVDARGSAIITTDMTPGKGDFDDIDPTVFIDDDGQAYLYWGNGKCKYVKLNDDMISFSGSIQHIDVPKFGEAPWLHKNNGVYYLSYSSSLPSTIEYCTSSSPTGPWVYQNRILEKVKNCATSHQAITNFKGKWYLVYHNGTLEGGGEFRRSVCVEEFKLNSDGSIPLITPTQEGVINAVSSINPFEKVEAETMAFSKGVETGYGLDNQVYITKINNGDFIKVRDVDFRKKGSKYLKMNVSPIDQGGNIEIRIDNLNGELLGTCIIDGMNEVNQWKIVTTKIKKVKGKHDIYFVFTGNSEKELFNFDWWSFK